MQLPEVCRLNASGELNVENIDVFCEKGVFGVEQTKRILKEGIRAGMRPNFHGEELAYLGSAEVGLEVDSRTVVERHKKGSLTVPKLLESKGSSRSRAMGGGWKMKVLEGDSSNKNDWWYFSLGGRGKEARLSDVRYCLLRLDFSS